MKDNPYQAVIDWLRSPAGENWSEMRMTRARNNGSMEDLSATLNDYGLKTGPLYLGGVLSVKEDG